MMMRTIEQVELHDNANLPGWEAHGVKHYHASEADSLLRRALVKERQKFTASLETGITEDPSEVAIK
jgi:hypothetical protein